MRSSQRSLLMVWLVFITFFVISFLTNIIGPILPTAKDDLKLSLTMAGILPVAFFIAYGVMSIPAGYMVERLGEKKVMIMAFCLATLGNFVFVLFPSFYSFLPSLFMIGLGMAMLQVVINPLLRTAGGEENYSFNSVLAQLIFGLASFISPVVYSYTVVRLQKADYSNPLISILSKVVPKTLPWVSIYWYSTLLSLLMVIVLCFIKFPKVELQEDEKVGGTEILKKLFSKKVVIFYFIGIFCYVGTEQGFNDWISKFLNTYHGYDPKTTGADAVADFWLMMTIGGIIGCALLKFINVKKVLAGAIICTLIFLTTALLGPGKVAIFAFSACGFMLSVMYPSIFSLALNSIDEHHGSFAGILCTAIIGGAVIPFLIGSLGDLLGLRFGMCFLYITLTYMLCIAIFAKPLIQNKTVFDNEKASKE